MRIVAVLSPVADWRAIVEAAQLADAAGLDGIGLWDNYHSAQPDWGYIAGWSAYGALAAATSRVRLVPMVLNWAGRGIGRVVVSIGSMEMPERVRILATCSSPDGSAPA